MSEAVDMAQQLSQYSIFSLLEHYSWVDNDEDYGERWGLTNEHCRRLIYDEVVRRTDVSLARSLAYNNGLEDGYNVGSRDGFESGVNYVYDTNEDDDVYHD